MGSRGPLSRSGGQLPPFPFRYPPDHGLEVMRRRDFLRNTSLGIAGGLVSATPAWAKGSPPGREEWSWFEPSAESKLNPGDWEEVRSQFPVDRSYIHMAGLFLVSHPKPVGSMVEELREELDANPTLSVLSRWGTDTHVRSVAARYAGCATGEIGLTGSTTMGLGILYHGLRLRAGTEILHTTHDHSVMDRSISTKAEHARATVRQISLYDDDRPEGVSAEEVLARLGRELRPDTRVLGVTWVHSKNGVKLPIMAMSQLLAEVNQGRNEEDQIILIVDGVHGFGVEDVPLCQLGCDLFSAGTHKWIFGPRGTGIVWGRPEVHDLVTPVIPSLGGGGGSWGARMTPGGFHAFEHRWALGPAFEFHLSIGKDLVQDRIHSLNLQLKEGLAQMSHVRLYTPISTDLSSGIICFDVEGRTSMEVVDVLLERHRIIASTTPYVPSHARLTPGLMNNEDEIESCLSAIRGLA